MSTHNTVPNQLVEVNGTKYAYRIFGISNGIPLVFLQHFRGTMDHWDPLLIDLIAKTRPVFLLDNAGVGRSSGTIPEDFEGWGFNVIAVCNALGMKQIDLLGFSVGSFVAQYISLDAPHLVRRVIFCSTSPSPGPGLEESDAELVTAFKNASTLEESESIYLRGFYSANKEKQALARAWWKRMNERKDRSDYVGPEGTERQVAALIKWSSGQGKSTYDRLKDLKLPVFVAAGANDTIVPTTNSIILARMIPTAHLHIYPDVGHGFLNEYATLFAEHVKLFLES